jgi:REP element-mobilizing transposase RayT
MPKCWRRLLYERPQPHLGEVFSRLAKQKKSKVQEGDLMPDHVHMLLSIPSRLAVSELVGFIKGKSAIYLARTYGEHNARIRLPRSPAAPVMRLKDLGNSASSTAITARE